MKLTIRQIKEKAIPVLKEYNVRRASLFGSYARGESTDKSDIDILVSIPRGIGLFGFVDLKLELQKKLRKKIDLIHFESIKPMLKKSILGNQIKII